jgi:hypothetical protein
MSQITLHWAVHTAAFLGRLGASVFSLGLAGFGGDGGLIFTLDNGFALSG